MNTLATLDRSTNAPIADLTTEELSVMIGDDAYHSARRSEAMRELDSRKSVKFIDIQTQEEVEFDAGYDCYYAGDELDANRSKDYRDGFKQAWYENNGHPGWKDPDGTRTDRAWDDYVDSL